ncbi:MAG TPA: MBL fold metallo-hydrolase, partial [Candidatus Dormibacteraeota bacterium]
MDDPYQASPDVYVLPTHLPIPGLGNLVINTFLLKSEEPVLIDTGVTSSPLEPDETGKFIAALESIIPLRDLRWVWLTHDDMDHTGSLQRVMELAPHARLATNAFAAMRMTFWWPVPLDRVHALAFDDRLDVGDRTLRAIAPPTFDNPTSTGILDEKTGTMFSVDSFGGLLPEVTTDCEEVPADALRQGMVAWMSLDSPWTRLVDTQRFDRVLDGVRQLAPQLILSSHLPAARGTCESFLEIVRSLRDAEPFPFPNNAQFQQMLAMMGPPPSANGAAAGAA